MFEIDIVHSNHGNAALVSHSPRRFSLRFILIALRIWNINLAFSIKSGKLEKACIF
jgi:hypothetical protein